MVYPYMALRYIYIYNLSSQLIKIKIRARQFELRLRQTANTPTAQPHEETCERRRLLTIRTVRRIQYHCLGGSSTQYFFLHLS